MFNAAENLIHRSFRFESEIAQRFGSDRGRQKAAHRLFRAAVRIVDQVRQRVEHRGRHTGRDLNRKRGRVSAPFPGNVEFHRDAVTAHLA